MKKILALMAGAAVLLSSAFFASCSNDDDDDDSSSGAITGGSIVGYVLDNKGEPVEGATVSLGSKQARTNSGGEFEIKNVAANDSALISVTNAAGTAATTAVSGTAYQLTATKKGYISATVTGIYVTKQELETGASAAYATALTALRTDYTSILTGYDTALGTGAASSTNTTTGTAGGDAIYTSTTSSSTDADSVMKVIAEALSKLKELYGDTEYYTEYYSDFAAAQLIPCDASFTGSIRLSLSQKGASVYSGETYPATSRPTVRAIYTTLTGEKYTFETTADSNGNFKFSKCLPSNVTLSFQIDAFTEKVKVGDTETSHYFSSSESVAILDNETREFDLANGTVTLGSAGSNEESVVILLYSQKDKVWITETNVISNTSANLLSVDTPLTFTFSQKLVKVAVTSTNITDILDGNFKAVIDSEDATKVTITPNDGTWTTAANPADVTLVVETAEGSTQVLNGKVEVYFDTNIWVAVETASHDDDDGRLALNSPIVLTFSKAMTENVVLAVGNTANYYNKTWSADKKTLTLTPDTYWDIAANPVTITVSTAKAADDTDRIKYWKANSGNGGTDPGAWLGLRVYFDNIVDVELKDASTSEHEAFTITFSKALKLFDVEGKKNIVSIKNADGDTVDDYIATIDADKKVVTVTSKDIGFLKAGKYKVTLQDIEAVDGSDVIRKKGDKDPQTTAATYEFETDFAYDGLTLKPVSIEVLPSLPATAKASRAIIDVTPASVLKVTFSKPIDKADIKIVDADDTATPPTALVGAKHKTYIDTADAKIVYVPLSEATVVKKTIVLTFDTVQATDGDTLGTLDADDIKKLYNGNEYYIVAALKLTGTSLIEANGDVNGNSTYKAADPVEAKSAITFTFEDLSEAKTATFDLYVEDKDNAGTYIKAADTVSATIDTDSNVVTVATDKLVSVPAVAGTTDGITPYYLSLVVKNESGVELFSTKHDFDVYIGSNEAFEQDFAGLIDAGTATTTNLGFNTIKVEVAPLSLAGSSLLTEETVLGEGTGTYIVANPIKPGASVTFTFSSEIPAGATVSYAIYDAPTGGKLLAEKSTELTAASKTVTIADAALVADTSFKDYYVTLVVKNGDDVLFSTESAYFGQASDYEKEITKDADSNGTLDYDYNAADYAGNSTALVDTANGKIVIEVVKTAVLTVRDDEESKTTTLDDFQKSYKSDIVLQFTHDVTDYEAVLYKDSVTPAPAAGDAYADFVADNEDDIYASTATVNGEVITIVPTNYFADGATVKVAIFNADGEFVFDAQTVQNKDDTAGAKDFATAALNGTADTTFLNELLKKTTPDTLTTATAAAKIGNGLPLALSVPTAYSAKSKKLATYTWYAKTSDDDDYTYIGKAEYDSTADAYAIGSTADMLLYDSEKGTDAVSVPNYRFGRAVNSYYVATQDANAFRYGATLSIVAIQELDGVYKVFKSADLKDGAAPSLWASANVDGEDGVARGTIAFTNLEGTGTFAVTTPTAPAKVNNAAYTLTVGAQAKSGTNTATASDFSLAITSIEGEWLKSATATVAKASGTSTATTNNDTVYTTDVAYNSASDTATITFTDAKWFKGDKITVTVEDASGNKTTFTITVD